MSEPTRRLYPVEDENTVGHAAERRRPPLSPVVLSGLFTLGVVLWLAALIVAGHALGVDWGNATGAAVVLTAVLGLVWSIAWMFIRDACDHR